MWIFAVAALAAAWIEICRKICDARADWVAALAAAWIEIGPAQRKRTAKNVAALAAAWIEMEKSKKILLYLVCRGPCGRVKGLFSNSPFFYGKLRKIIHFQRKRLRFPLAGKRKSFKIGGRRFAKPFKKRTARSALMKERLIFVFTISLSLYCHFSGSKAPLRR